ncbi:MAG: DUF4905 domain-containing protein [Microscillaceae bacterium]|nr:DUF4905 domain-containing protein [Microscillaceae bacterium]
MDTQQPWVALEIRDAEAWQTRFALIDLSQPACVWEDLQMEENWWIGLSDVQAGVLLLHTFAEESRPQPTHLLALDAPKAVLRWQVAQRQFCGWFEEGLVWGYTEAEGTQKYEKVSLLEGRVLQSLLPTQAGSWTKPHYLDFSFPHHYPEGSAAFKTLEKFAKNHLYCNIQGEAAYWEYKNLMIMAFFYEKEAVVLQDLLILNNEAQILLRETLSTDYQGLTKDVFFLFQQYLFVIKNKHQLQVYCL